MDKRKAAVAVVVLLFAAYFACVALASTAEDEEEAGPVEYALSSIYQADYVYDDDGSTVSKGIRVGWTWVYARFTIYSDSDPEESEMPTLTLETDDTGKQRTYEAEFYDLYEGKWYDAWTVYWLVPAVYSDGEEVTAKNVADYVTVNYPEDWTVKVWS